MNTLREYLSNTKVEPFVILGGSFTFTALYYTRRLPLQIGMIDFSPLVAFVALQFLHRVIVAMLYQLGGIR